MFQVIEGDTADELWTQAARLFLPGGGASRQQSRGGLTAEVLHAALAIRNPRQRWIPSRVPSMNPAFALAEVIWIVCGRNDSAFLNYFNPRLPEYQGYGETFDGAYGFRLRRHFGTDQLDQAYQALRSNQESRQIVLQIWDSRTDMPKADGSPRSKDIPCNIVAILKVRDGKLEWTQIMRSNDLFLGLPHNIVQFTTLQEILAGWLGLEPGPYHHFSDSLHLYEKDEPVVERMRHVEMPLNTDSIAIGKPTSDIAFQQLSDFVDAITKVSESDTALFCRLEKLSLPQSFMNFAAILAAEGFRRRKSLLLEAALKKCTNACLTFLFNQWMLRNSSDRRCVS